MLHKRKKVVEEDKALDIKVEVVATMAVVEVIIIIKVAAKAEINGINPNNME